MTGPNATTRRDPRRHRGVFWPYLLATLLLLPATAWVGGYFWANSSAGQKRLTDWLAGRAPEGSLTLGLAQWGPLPQDLELLDVFVRAPDGSPVAGARHVDAELSLGALLDGDLHLEAVAARDVTLHLAWDREGALNLTRALSRPKKPSADKPKPKPKPKRHKRALTFDGVSLERVDLSLEWPTWGLQFADVDATGRVTLTPDAGLSIDADLDAGLSGVIWKDERRVTFDSVAIDTFRWRDSGFTVERLALLNSDGGSAATIHGEMAFGSEVTLDAKGDIALAAVDAETLLPGVLPEGADIDGLSAVLGGGKLDGSVAEARAPVVTAGPVRAEGVRVPIDAVTIVPGLLRPTGSLKMSRAHADLITAPHDVNAEGVDIDLLTMTIRGKSSADLQGVRVTDLTLPGGHVGPATARGRVGFGLTSGELEGNLETDQGVIGASGKLRLNPLTQRLMVTTRFAVERVAGAVAATILDFIPDDHRAALTPPLDGYAVFKTRLAREKRSNGKGKRWTPRTKVTDASLEGRARVTFDGDRWARAPAEELPRP